MNSEDAMLAILTRWEEWPDDSKNLAGFNDFMKQIRREVPDLLRWVDLPRSQVENEVKGRFLLSGLIH